MTYGSIAVDTGGHQSDTDILFHAYPLAKMDQAFEHTARGKARRTALIRHPAPVVR